MSNKLMSLEQIQTALGETVLTLNTMSKQISKIPALEERMKFYDENITLNRREKYDLSELVKTKVIDVVKRNKFTYKKVSSILFPMFWRQIKEQFKVNSYHDVPRVEYRDALKVIRNYKLTDEEIERLKEKNME